MGYKLDDITGSNPSLLGDSHDPIIELNVIDTGLLEEPNDQNVSIPLKNTVEGLIGTQIAVSFQELEENLGYDFKPLIFDGSSSDIAALSSFVKSKGFDLVSIAKTNRELSLLEQSSEGQFESGEYSMGVIFDETNPTLVGSIFVIKQRITRLLPFIPREGEQTIANSASSLKGANLSDVIHLPFINSELDHIEQVDISEIFETRKQLYEEKCGRLGIVDDEVIYRTYLYNLARDFIYKLQHENYQSMSGYQVDKLSRYLSWFITDEGKYGTDSIPKKDFDLLHFGADEQIRMHNIEDAKGLTVCLNRIIQLYMNVIQRDGGRTEVGRLRQQA